jgi:hypothetical protein
MTIVIPSSSAELMANPARFLEDIRAGHFVYLADLGGTVALAETDDEVEDMVSLRSEKTGMDNTIFISTKGYARAHAAHQDRRRSTAHVQCNRKVGVDGDPRLQHDRRLSCAACS